jgi:hypothetical protein
LEQEEDIMKDDVWKDNKERYDELNPSMTAKAMVMWAAVAVAVASVIIAAAIWT